MVRQYLEDIQFFSKINRLCVRWHPPETEISLSPPETPLPPSLSTETPPPLMPKLVPPSID